METELISPVKINLILRILDRRSDGFHNIYSLFCRKYSAERLTIKTKCCEIMGDTLNVDGAEISGENLVTKALSAARKKNGSIPCFDMRLKKVYPAGSGIGAGSGNAGALLRFLAEHYGAAFSGEEIAALGADVAFLASGREAAEARGAGELLEPFTGVPEMSWMLAFPEWSSNTAQAYARLDARREAKGFTPPEESELTSERDRVISALKSGRSAGRLPNDFFEVLAGEHDEYLHAEERCSEAGLPGWGLCGSGSAFFALCRNGEEALRLSALFRDDGWIQTEIL